MPTPQKLPTHPGIIEFFDGDLDRKVSTMQVDESTPETIYLAADTNGVLTPIVTVVLFSKGDNRKSVHEYSEDGSLLRSSIFVTSDTDK